MTEYQVIGVIVTLVGLGVAIITPIIKLNTNIVRLTVAADNLTVAHSKMDKDNEAAHKQLHERINHRKKENEELDERVSDHERRIGILENK